MRFHFGSKKKMVVLIFVALIIVIAAVFATRTFFKPAQLATETAEQIGKRIFSGGFNFTDEERAEANPLFKKLRSGGPPKDGIPSIDNPKFESATEANNWLKPDDLVLGFFHKDEARAYPLRILNWHEIVNDTVAGDAVLMTYCPLCFTGIAFSRVVNGQAVEFGTSGNLINSNLVMYDRTTDSLWTQLGGEAIIGVNLGEKLTQLPSDTVTWADWKSAHPETKVLSRDTGFARDYDFNPYEGYEVSRDTFGTPFTDSRLHPKDKVFGIEISGKFKAYSDAALKVGKTADNFADVDLEITKDSPGAVKFTNKKTNQEIVPTISYWFAWLSFHPETELLK